ncbi:carboxypeptidase-like regulatory domain-containing protein [Granulicella sp. dw_53]|uniref:carboxypeptidase-like regulatory domain-containing protein n=1 Tax=Granulicella sp. dw_53 TaxID=2719792 RepID=UPI001BD5438D|nr:carboxypeptidase-like regulatory domain-containing protein [Granulicella sp. dw_53]
MQWNSFLSRKRWLVFALLFPVMAHSVFSQTSTTGAIRGTVTDSQNAVIVGATVTVTSSATGQLRTVKTDKDGQFTVGLLPPEIYRISVAVPGFKKAEPAPVTVVVTETARADAQMVVGNESETVEVSSAAAALQVENATLGTVVDGRTIQEVPLTNRNYTQVLTLSAGVAGDVNNAASLGKGTQDVYVNGASSISNNFHMDGADINNFGSGRAGDFVQQAGIAIPNPDALQEFKIQTTNYDAGFGRDAGANVDVVTKTGTNAIHGSMWEFFRNDVLNANDTFLKIGGQKRAVMKQNQFGGTLGGPIVKDKLFFFGSYQGTRQINGLSASSLASNSLFPLTDDRSAAAIGKIACPNGSTATTPAGRAKWAPFNGGVNVACDGSNISPVALNLLRQKIANGTYLIPTPQRLTTDTNGNPIGLSTFSIPSHYSEDQFLVNTDYVLTSKHTFSQRYFYSRQPQTQPFSSSTNTPGNGVTPNFNSQVGVLKLTSALNAHFLNEALVGYIRSVGRLQTQANLTFDQIGMTAPSDPTYPLTPIISTTGYFNLGGVNNDVSFSAVNTFEISDQISWTHGKQSFRAGFLGEKNQFNFDDPNNKRGSVGFQTFQDFLLGMSAAQNGSAFSNVNSSGSQQGSYYKGFRGTSMAMFLQDDIKLRSNLTVNAGVRWELNSGVSANHGQLSSFYPSLVTPFQPVPVGGTFQGFVVPNNYRLPLPAGVTRLGSTSLSDNDIPLHNFGPRVGFAWQPLGAASSTVVRGGYGVFYTLTNANSVLQTLGGQPFVSSATLTGTANAAATFQTPFTTVLTPGVWRPRSTAYTLTVTGVAQNIDSPMVQQYNMDIQQELPDKFVIEAGYVGTRGTRLAESRGLNRAFLASPSNPINGVTTNTVASANLQARVPYQGFTPNGVTRIETYGFSSYNSLQSTLKRQVGSGLYLQAAYTWSKIMTSVTGGDGQNGVFSGGSGNSNDPNNRYARWGVAGYDRTNRFVFAYIWQVPSWKNGGAFARVATGGWRFSGVTTFQSGKPLTFTDANNGTAYGTTSRAQFVPGKGNGDILNKNGGSLLNRIKNNTYLNPSASVFVTAPAVPFSAPASATSTILPTDYGNSSIGVARGPGNNTWDMTLAKSTKVGGLREDATLDFRTEFFNVWNHPQYANPSTGAQTANYGVINASSVAPRLIQFALKYVF